MSRSRANARCTDSAAHNAASNSLSPYVHQNSEGDKPDGIADGHANTATSRKDGQQRSPTYSQHSFLRTTRAASLYLTGLVTALMAFPMGASSFRALCFTAIGTSLIGIGSTLAIWLKRKR